MRRLALSVALLLALTSASSSKIPAIPEGPSTQEQPAAEQGAEHAPLGTKVKSPNQAQTETGAAGEHRKNQGNNSWGLSDKIAAVAIIVGFLQFVALVATVIVMIGNGRRELRAYVLVKGAKLESWDSVDDPATATIVVRNYGQTPAYSVDSYVGVAAHDYPLKIEVKPPSDMKTVKSILAPGGEHIFRVPTLRPLDSDEIALVSGGYAAIYVVGRISYVDAFKKDQVTNFLLFYGGEIGTAPDGLMGPYETGNDAT